MVAAAALPPPLSSSLIVDTVCLLKLAIPSGPDAGGGCGGVGCLDGELGSEAAADNNDSLNNGAGIVKLGRLRASLDFTFCRR